MLFASPLTICGGRGSTSAISAFDSRASNSHRISVSRLVSDSIGSESMHGLLRATSGVSTRREQAGAITGMRGRQRPVGPSAAVAVGGCPLFRHRIPGSLRVAQYAVHRYGVEQTAVAARSTPDQDTGRDMSR